MNAFHKVLSIGLIALPLAAGAQTANTPGGQASTGSKLDTTNGKPSAPINTSTSPDMTNPSGTLPGKTPKSNRHRLGHGTETKTPKAAHDSATPATNTVDPTTTK